nr:hypothetical protein [Gemmatimonadaceae bacterium]
MHIASLLRRGAATLISMTTLVACGADSTQPSARPTSIAPTTASTAAGTAGLALTSPPSFVVNDQNGTPLAGIAVSVAVTAGGGTISGAPAVTAAGPTPIGSWTLGKTAGENT